METAVFIKSTALMLVILNPFLLAIYLLKIIRELNFSEFAAVMFRGGVISWTVFVLFAWGGDFIFVQILQVRFAAFLIFGGVVFFLVGLQFLFRGPQSVELLRGTPKHLAGAVAMPFMIGPGTIQASILTGVRLNLPGAMLAIATALAVTVLIVIGFKSLHDYSTVHNAQLVDRYVDLCGRVSALVIGSISVEMILQGIERWLDSSSF